METSGSRLIAALGDLKELRGKYVSSGPDKPWFRSREDLKSHGPGHP